MEFSNNPALEQFLATKTIYGYKKAFPTAQSDLLKRVYYLTTIENDLKDSLVAFSDIKNVYFLGDRATRYKPLYEPNDYENLFNPFWNTHLELINAPRAWNVTQGDNTVYVGIMEISFETTHEDLINQIAIHNEVNPNNPGHGTRVAGMVAAETNNNKGVSSIGFNTKLVLDETIGGSVPFTSQVLTLSQTSGVKVINLSTGDIEQPNPVDAEAYREVWEDNGVVTVAAAGNGYGGSDNTSYFYPASYEHVISVTSVGHKYDIGSNNHPIYGKGNWKDVHEIIIGDPNNPIEPTHQHNDKVDICAAGYELTTTTINNAYTTNATGTSYAAPTVAGVVALMFAVNPNITPDEVKNILENTAVDIYDIPENQAYIGKLGAGRVNAYGAVLGAQCLDATNPELDLVIWDSDEDMGTEPNNATPYMWRSPEIWVRNSPDKSKAHENPEYDPNGSSYIYVRITNTGCLPALQNNQLKVYWAKAGTGLEWPNDWVDSQIGSLEMGDLLATVDMPALYSGEEVILEVEWDDVPNPEDYGSLNGNPWHFCLLARVESMDDPIGTEKNSINYNVKYNNNIAWKNISIVDEEINRAAVSVSNPFHIAKSFDLEFKIDDNEGGKPIYEEAEVFVEMGDALYQAWQDGGGEMYNFQETENEKHKLVIGENAKLYNVNFDPQELGTMNLTFNFLTEEITEKTRYTYNVVQKITDTDSIIGGETYIIKKNTARQLFFAEAGSDKNVPKEDSMTVSASQINEPATYNWYDPEGNLIYTGPGLTLSPEITKKYKLEIIAHSDGYKDYDEVEIKVSPYSLDNMIPNPASNQVTVRYDAQDASSAYLMLTNLNMNVSNNYILDITQSNKVIDLSAYSPGVYVVSLVCDGEIVASENLVVN